MITFYCVLLGPSVAGERQALVVLGDLTAELREVIDRERLAGTFARELFPRQLPGHLRGEGAVGLDVIREQGLEVVRERATAEADTAAFERSRAVSIEGPDPVHAERHDEPSILWREVGEAGRLARERVVPVQELVGASLNDARPQQYHANDEPHACTHHARPPVNQRVPLAKPCRAQMGRLNQVCGGRSGERWRATEIR